jgi:hypothetical protein
MWEVIAGIHLERALCCDVARHPPLRPLGLLARIFPKTREGCACQ